MIISVFPYIENESVRRLTGDVQHGGSGEARLDQAGDRIRHARAGAGEQHAEMAHHARIGVGHVRAAHLAAAHHVAQRIALADGIEHRDVVHGHDAEDGRYAHARQDIRDEIGNRVRAWHEMTFPRFSCAECATSLADA